MEITNGGTGAKIGAEVTQEHEQLITGMTTSLQAHISAVHAGAFQVIGKQTALTPATHTLLHVQNDSDEDIAFTYLRAQIAGAAGGTFGAGTFFQIGFGTTRSSGGTLLTPVQLNRNSNKSPNVIVYEKPTVTGTFEEIDIWYPKENEDKNTWSKEGAIILGNGDTLEIRITTDHTSGIAWARASFVNIVNHLMSRF